MNIIKNNLWSIVWGVVALICLIVPFWPMGGYQSELTSQAEARAGIYNDLTSLLSRRRAAPVIDPNDPREANLGIFPNDTLIKSADTALSKLATESQKLQQAAETISADAHKALLEEALPRRKGGIKMAEPDFAIRLRFKDRYFAAAPDAILNGILHAGMPPTLEQVTAGRTAVEVAMRANAPVIGGAPQIDPMAIEEEKQQVAARMKLEAAAKCLIYVDPAVFPRHDDMNMLGGQAPTIKMIWNAQLWYWIQEDVARAIANINTGSQDVRVSPIKRIRALNIEVVDKDPLKWSLSKSIDGKMADYKPDEDSIPRRLDVSPSGRVSCGLYDVIRFRLDMDVDAVKMTSTIQNLSRNNFISVLAVQRIHPVDRALEQAGDGPIGGYLYGDNPVVNIVLDCEMLYMRSWTIPFMPDDVRKDYAEGVQRRDQH